MRIRTGLVLGLLLALPLAGCAKGGGGDDQVATATGATPTASASAPGGGGTHDPKDEQAAMLKYAQCMRDQGIPMDDPQFEGDGNGGGGISMTLPEGTDKTKVDAANEACKQFMPNGGQPMKANPEQLEEMRKMAQCMREHGVPNFPDPSEDGGFMIDGDKLGIDMQGQTFKDAQTACAEYGPKGGPGPQTNEHTENGGGSA